MPQIAELDKTKLPCAKLSYHLADVQRHTTNYFYLPNFHTPTANYLITIQLPCAKLSYHMQDAFKQSNFDPMEAIGLNGKVFTNIPPNYCILPNYHPYNANYPKTIQSPGAKLSYHMTDVHQHAT